MRGHDDGDGDRSNVIERLGIFVYIITNSVITDSTIINNILRTSDATMLAREACRRNTKYDQNASHANRQGFQKVYFYPSTTAGHSNQTVRSPDSKPRVIAGRLDLLTRRLVRQYRPPSTSFQQYWLDKTKAAGRNTSYANKNCHGESTALRFALMWAFPGSSLGRFGFTLRCATHDLRKSAYRCCPRSRTGSRTRGRRPKRIAGRGHRAR